MRKLRDTLHIPFEAMLYIGDAIFPGGNDYAVFEAGIDCIAVRDPEDSKRVTATIIALEK
jgi:phosphomannomutase